ncbi:MAG: HAMP domain-containing histidine kinase, partial [FCB group bacterium]|nr:HAMP domain-containing histidine kinase [FCB group bacterium]
FDYILKPFELHEIRQAVNKAVEHIKKKSLEKKSEQQLDSINDLHQMLFSGGDKKSLVVSSLKFAMMHSSSDCGSVLYCDADKTNFYMISLKDEKLIEDKLPHDLLFKCLDSLYLWEYQKPLIVTKVEEHPLYKVNPDPQLKNILFPSWKKEEKPIIMIPISRSYSNYGLLMIGCEEDVISPSDPSLKFLTITAHQLAMSLENLELLEETQKAYSRLKDLQDETIQLEKMATRGEMSAEIGHELNNFLGVVAGNLSLLDFQLKKKNYEELGKYVTAMTDNIEKIKKFTNNLMDLQPISSKKEIVYFDKLIKEVIDYLRPQKRFQEVTINLLPITDRLPLEADNIHIQQLLYNIFNNAADATNGCDQKEITVSAHINSDKKTFRLTVKDTGTGIDPKFLEKAFKEKFTTKKNGHGFGLLVCKRIIDSHEGQLYIDSKPGEGTAISIDFPLKTVTEKILSPA